MCCTFECWPATSALDDASFARQMTLYDPALCRYAARLSASAADAEDLTQDTFLKCWSAQHRFASGTNFIAWARTIMRNTFFTSVRRSRHEVDIADDHIEHLQVTAPAQLTALELKETLLALDNLDAGQRSAVIMASNGVSLKMAQRHFG